MAVNVAHAPRRETQQKRAGTFRGAFLPEPDSRLAAVKIAADLRNAYRPDSADEVRRVLGMVNDTAEKYVELDNARFEQQAREDAAQGVQDEALGRVQEDALPSRSTAYRTAISWSRVRKRAAELEVAITPEIEALLAQGANADPTQGDEVVDLEDVNALLDDRFKALLIDPEGNPVDFGDPAANTFLYDKLNDVRIRVNARAAEIIQEQEQQKVLLGLSDEVELDAKEGDLNVETYVSRAVTLGIDPRAAKQTFLTAAINGARVGENPEVLLTLADSRRTDGTPSWNPTEENQLREAYFSLNTRLEAEREKEAEDRSQATIGRLEIDIRTGVRLNPETIRGLIASGELRPEDADVAFAIQDRYDDNAWQQVQRQRANIAWNQSQSDRAEARARVARVERGGGAFDALRIGMLSGELSGTQAQRAIRSEFAAGRLTVNQYETLSGDAAKIPTGQEIVRERDAGGYQSQLDRVIARARLRAGTPGHIGRADFEQRATTATETFYRQLRGGAENDVALAQGLHALGVPAQHIRGTVQGARQRGTLED